ncbi:tyrosine/dopa decarboxylase [Thraustotheca clavata]|uniref:Tyrosine/dopa decarboxylase n=1 Tax=Thraustotheca clavata TaxID=74557 RepID=A0A1V9ZYC8_9STRA|nr:tyrosine/dopa decarboxylase [Thraustotheca clavata]
MLSAARRSFARPLARCSSSLKEPLAPAPADYDWEAFRKNAHQTIDFIVDYNKKLASRELPVLPSCQPGDVRRALPAKPSETPVPWSSILKDVENIVVPNMTHWQHPDFMAYFPAQAAPSAMLGELMANAMNQPGFNWICSPAATEMELHVMEWLREAFGLPEDMSWKGSGGGLMQPSATEGMIVAQVSARTRKLSRNPDLDLDNLVSYFSDQSHFCVEKASKVLGVKHIRKIPSVFEPETGNYAMDLSVLEATIKADEAAGLAPFFVSGNFGATGVCAIDDLEAMSVIAKEHDMWLNMDSAYAGVVALLPEYRDVLGGMQVCDSLLMNGSKWFHLMFNSSFFFFKDKRHVVEALNATGAYLDNKHTSENVVFDLKDYQLGLGRPFRGLKAYCTIQSMGLQGFRDGLRRHIQLTKYLAEKLREQPRIEVIRDIFGLVCFRVKDADDDVNTQVMEHLNQVEGIHMVHTVTADHGVVLRIALCHPQLGVEDMDRSQLLFLNCHFAIILMVIRAVLLCFAAVAVVLASECTTTDLAAINANAKGCVAGNSTTSSGSNFMVSNVCQTQSCQSLLALYRELNCTVNDLTGSEIAMIACPDTILRPHHHHHYYDDEDDDSEYNQPISLWSIVVSILFFTGMAIGVYFIWKRYGDRIRQRMGWVPYNSYVAATAAADAELSNGKLTGGYSVNVLVPAVQLQAIKKDNKESNPPPKESVFKNTLQSLNDTKLPPIPSDYDWEQFRTNAHKTIDFIVDYQKKLHSRQIPVLPTCQPGDLRRSLSVSAPEKPVAWDQIMEVVSQQVVPRMTHWQHPDFYAYFPSMAAPSAILGDMMASAMNQPGFNWICSPAATELELHVMDWLREAFSLPETMSWNSTGGGVMQPSATEGMIVAQVSARTRKLAQNPDVKLNDLVSYYSDQAHFCCEKASKVLGIQHLRKITSVYDPATGNYVMDAALLESTIAADVAKGLTPFFVSTNFGATGVCAVDDIPAIASVANKYKVWLNIDAAYAGVVAILPEMRPKMHGVDFCDSILINGSKWFNLLFNSSFMFFTQKEYVVRALNATGSYLENKHTADNKVFDLKDYQLGLGRPFRSLKAYCTIQSMGLQGFRDVLNRHIQLAKYLAAGLETTKRIDIVRKVEFGLVCFRVKNADDATNMKVMEKLNQSEGVHFVHTVTAHHGVVLRIALCHPQLTTADMDGLIAKIVRSLP